MGITVIPTAVPRVGVSRLTIRCGLSSLAILLQIAQSLKTNIRSLADLDKRVVGNRYKKEHRVKGVSQDEKVKGIQVLIGWFKSFKKARDIYKTPGSHMVQVKNVKSRRRGMYTFLYGGRVNVNTFYDYKD